MATFITPKDEIIEVSPKNGDKFTLEELQGFVGGLIEIINLSPKSMFVINDNGKLDGLDINFIATAAARNLWAIDPTDCIVGNALLVDDTEID